MSAAGGRHRKPDSVEVERYFSRISQLDYASRLARRFDRSQMREVVTDLRRSLPMLNRTVFRETNLNRLASVADELDVTLRVESLPGLGIRGFYINDSAFSARPLIVLNAASHPVAVAAAFWHEIGHHLTNPILGKRRDRMNLTFSGSEHHLGDPKELLADIVMTLGAYPATTAKRLFGGVKPANDRESFVDLVSKASGHVKSVSGFEVSGAGPTKAKLHMMAGMIHLAKLRIALLEGYGI